MLSFADVPAEIGPYFSIVVEPAHEEVRLQAVGELDLAATPTLRDQVSDLLAAGFKQMVIDLRRVTFIDLIGVRLLLKLAQDARNDGWRLSLIEAGGQMHRLFTLTGVLDQMPFEAPMAELPTFARA